MSLITSILISLSLIMGLSASPSEPVSQPASVTCEEDMPCWDSATMGQQLPALHPLELDAWDTISASQITSPTPDLALEYVESITYMPSSFPVGYFATESTTEPQTFHVFHWVTLYHA